MSFDPMLNRVPILKRAIPSIKKRLARFTTVDGYMVGRARGAVFLLNVRNFVDRKLAFYRDFEPEQVDYFLSSMRRLGCDLFLDVGANIGFYSVLVAREGLAKRIVSFEPDERNRLQFGANILANNLIGRIQLESKAVTSSSGEADFHQAGETSTGQSHLGRGRDGSAVRVATVALDDILSERGQSIFLKIDVEGHELEALAGMTGLLSGNKVFLQIESFGEQAVALADTLAKLGIRHCHRVGDDHYFSNHD
jgi:FkbM family methyltransferase